jgi:hypothetical protein
MTDVERVMSAIEEGFARTPHPGAEFLQGSREGCEPGEAVEPFRAFTDWRDVPADTLNAQYTALSFFSKGGFRFFLPAYLVADVRNLLMVDPLFHLTGHFGRGVVEVPAGDRTFVREIRGGVLLNPRRYGAIIFEDYARYRLSVFCREEARAIVAYLAFRRDKAELDIEREDIDTALAAFWKRRAEEAPTASDLQAHFEREQDFIAGMTSA